MKYVIAGYAAIMLVVVLIVFLRGACSEEQPRPKGDG